MVLHSSWRGRLTAWLVPLLLVAWGGYGVGEVGFRVFNSLVLGVGLFLLAVGIFDFPLRTTLSSEGVSRHCLGRTQRIAWGTVSALARPATKGVAGSRRARGGLVAQIKRRHFMLCDKLESLAEYEAVRTLLAESSPGVPLRAREPETETAPTWMYKRRAEAVGADRVDHG